MKGNSSGCTRKIWNKRCENASILSFCNRASVIVGPST